MSDITGPPAPKPVTPISHGTDKLARASKDPNQTPRQTTDDSSEQRAKSEQKETPHVRDPAVSISATAAHLRVGEELKQQVQSIDSEGRPIIVTETATFALRPDAGLKPGDDVILQVAETGKQVSADLLNRNGLVIDPPVRLDLIVIALHVTDSGVPNQPEGKPTPTNAAYRPVVRPPNTTAIIQGPPPATETETLAALLSRTSLTPHTSPVQSPPTNPPSGLADNPDPLVHASSRDLATLIAAQQTNTVSPDIAVAPTVHNPVQPAAAQPAPPSPTPAPQSAPVVPQASGVSIVGHPNTAATEPQARLLPSSPLTEPVAVSAQSSPANAASPAAGLGPPIKAVTLAGNPVQIQLLDPSISQVSPSEVAEVKSVQALPPDVARSLPIGLRGLGEVALARLETEKGTFIVNQQAANSLVGEYIRYSTPPQTSTQTNMQTGAQSGLPASETTVTQPQLKIPSHRARLISPASQESRLVQVQFIPQNQLAQVASNASQSHILTTVDSVHTMRAFLTGTGPRTDFRLGTTFGDLTITLAAGKRPAVGDTVAILPAPATTSGTNAPPIFPAGTPEAMAAQQMASGTWASLEQVSGLLGATPAASSLLARSAQGGGKLLNSMMFMMAALKGGSPSQWLGKSIEGVLSSKNNDLLRLLRGELSRLFNAGAESASEWRSLILPFDVRGGEVSLLTALFSQGTPIDPDGHHDSATDSENEEEDQRFVIEVQFSVLGQIQLEGSIRDSRFDLTLWSESALPSILVDDTSDLFNKALAANGFNGGLRFRHGEKFPVDVATILKQQLAA